MYKVWNPHSREIFGIYTDLEKAEEVRLQFLKTAGVEHYILVEEV